MFCVESIFSNTDDVISPSKPHITITSKKCHNKFLEHAGNLQQLSEMDANLKKHIALGGILHLASINPGNEDSNSCNDSSLIESASVNIPQLKVSTLYSMLISLHVTFMCNHVIYLWWATHETNSVDDLFSNSLYVPCVMVIHNGTSYFL